MFWRPAFDDYQYLLRNKELWSSFISKEVAVFSCCARSKIPDEDNPLSFKTHKRHVSKKTLTSIDDTPSAHRQHLPAPTLRNRLSSHTDTRFQGCPRQKIASGAHYFSVAFTSVNSFLIWWHWIGDGIEYFDACQMAPVYLSLSIAVVLQNMKRGKPAVPRF